MNVLGIDLGAKFVGLAVVIHPQNEVIYSCTLELRDLRDVIKERRGLRRARRNEVRYRRPKEPSRGGGAGREKSSAPLYQRASGMNRSLHTKCKFVNKETGEECGRNTPLKANVRDLLLGNIVRWLKISDEQKQAIMGFVDPKSKSPTPLTELLHSLKIDTYSKKQIKDVLTNKLSGRAVFCREHIPLYTSQADVDKESRWLAPSVLQKRLDILSEVREISQRFPIEKVVIERANFNLQRIQRGELLEPEDYQQGPRFMFRNTFEALKQEYYNQCCYCGKKGTKVKLDVDHVIPRGRRGGDTWDNLVLACEACNHKKGNRTPEEAGMKFHSFNEKRGDQWVKISLKPKDLHDSRITRYMTQTDIGIRYFEKLLKETLGGDIPIEECHGYETSYYRNKWELPKEHSNDAAVVASLKPHDTPETRNAPKFLCGPQEIHFKVKGKRLFDMNPLQKRGRGFYQRVPILEEKGGLKIRQIDKVVDPRKKKILLRLRDKYGLKGEKTFEKEHLKEIPFKVVVIPKKDASEGNVRRIERNWYKVTEPNVAAVVYKDEKGKLRRWVKKNPLVFRETNRPPGDFQGFVKAFKKGQVVRYKNSKGQQGLDGAIKKIYSDGYVDVEGKKVNPARCERVVET